MSSLFLSIMILFITGFQYCNYKAVFILPHIQNIIYTIIVIIVQYIG